MKCAPFLFCAVIFLSCASAKPKSAPVIADADPVSVGAVSFGMEKVFSSDLDEREAAVFFDPRTDTVYLQFSYQTVKYRQFWSKASRELFITAVEQYQKDAEAQNLTLKKTAARRAYGSAKGKVEWGQFSFSFNGRSYPRMDAGYIVKKGSPYFTVVQHTARDTVFDNRESVQLIAYFTRTQSLALAAIFDRAYLLSSVGQAR